MNASPLLATLEAATFLGLSEKTLANWRCRGYGPKFIRLGARVIRYHVDELSAWLNTNVRTSTCDIGVTANAAKRRAQRPHSLPAGRPAGRQWSAHNAPSLVSTPASLTGNPNPR